MSHPDPIRDATDSRPDHPAPARALIERQLGLLTELADIGMEIARAAGRQAVAALEGEAEPAKVDPGLTYTRAARAVRMTIALQARLLKELPALDRADAAVRREQTHARKLQIHRLVKQVIEAEPEDEIEALSGGLWERLHDADEYGDLIRRPVGEVVASICKDLGLSPDWGGLGEELWAASPLSEGAAAPASPQSRLRSGGLIGEQPVMEPRSCVVQGAVGRCRPP